MNKTKSREEWKQEVDNYKTSGLSIKRYCKEHGISPSTFSYWKKKFILSGDEKKALVKLSTSFKPEGIMKLSYNRVTIEFPIELSSEKITLLISALKEV
jgi:hypothetical protein